MDKERLARGLNTPTGVTEHRIISTGLGAAHYGNCERCGKPCIEHFKRQRREEWERPNGTLYWSAWHSCGYGHVECLRDGEWALAPVLPA